jgi:hypothetical protein
MKVDLADGTFRFIGIKTDLIPTSWNRFFYVDQLQLVGVLIRLNFKKEKNPFLFALSIKISVLFFNIIGYYFLSST